MNNLRQKTFTDGRDEPLQMFRGHSMIMMTNVGGYKIRIDMLVTFYGHQYYALGYILKCVKTKNQRGT